MSTVQTYRQGVEVGQQLLLIQHTVILVAPLMLPVFVLFVLAPTVRLVPVLIPSSVSIVRTVQYTTASLVRSSLTVVCCIYYTSSLFTCLCTHICTYVLIPSLFSLAVGLPICLCTPFSSVGVLSEQTNCFCASIKASHSTQKPTSWLG